MKHRVKHPSKYKKKLIILHGCSCNASLHGGILFNLFIYAGAMYVCYVVM